MQAAACTSRPVDAPATTRPASAPVYRANRSPARRFNSLKSMNVSAASTIACWTSAGIRLPPSIVTQLLPLMTRFSPRLSNCAEPVELVVDI